MQSGGTCWNQDLEGADGSLIYVYKLKKIGPIHAINVALRFLFPCI